MGKFSQFKVQLASKADGRYEQDFVCDTEFFRNMENEEVFSSVVDLAFPCRGMMQIPCDRCLDPLDHEVDTTYHITVKYGDSYNDVSDDLLVIPESDTYLNVAYMLYDTLLLTIPLRHVHPLGKCHPAMAAALHKHHTSAGDDVDEALDEVDSEIENEASGEED